MEGIDSAGKSEPLRGLVASLSSRRVPAAQWLAGAVMCEQNEIWQESRHFTEARMNELYDDGRTRVIAGPVKWARLEA